MKKITSLSFLFTFLLLLVLAPACFAQEKITPTETDTQAQQITIKQRIAELEAKLQSVKEHIDKEKQPGAKNVRLQYGISEDELQRYVQLLVETEAVIQLHITSLRKQASLMRLQKKNENVLTSPQDLAISLLPPYSLSELDEYLDKLEVQNRLEETAELSQEIAQKNLEDAKIIYAEAEQNLRTIREDAEQQAGKDEQTVYEFKKIAAALELDFAEAVLSLNLVYLQNNEIEVNLAQQQRSILNEQIKLIRANLKYDEEDLQKKLNLIASLRQQHNERIQSLASEQQEVQAKWLKAKKQIESTKDRDKEIKLIAKIWLDAREAWKNTYQQAFVQTQNILRLLSFGEEIWHRRYALLQGNYTLNQLKEWRNDLESTQKSIDRLNSLVSSSQNDLQLQILKLQVTLSREKETLPPEALSHLLSKQKAMEKLSANNIEYISKLQTIEQLISRFIDEIHEKRKSIQFMDLAKAAALTIDKKLDFEIYVIDDKSITIKKILLALIILSVGLFLANLFSKFVAKRLLSKTRLDESAKAAIHKVSFFLLIIILVLYALHTVHIPFTILTLLGGAVAIGVGFGSQNLINNFISGFILMFERPIKIDDIIEVDNIIGRVQHIGTRCTQIRTQANLNILIPNSSLLEKNIINWTLSDDVVRCIVSVGVAYGSSTRETVKALKKALEEYELILKKPEPVIVFKDFGDSALIFEVYFWIQLGKGRMVKVQAESNVRYLIEKHLREADIVVAFPQQDVHLDTSKPIDMRIINGDKNDAPSA
jgi:small-conductance mechanosensitive channel